MRTALGLTAVITILLMIIILKLLLKIRVLRKKNKYVDEANMWHRLAVTDDLTGIYNRNAYNIYMERAKVDAKHKERGIILFDVDNFKIINDTQGHLAGDAVLKNVAKNLTEVFLEPQYSVFRIGGDEFAVLSKGVSEKEMIERLIILRKILNDNGDISLSIGYSMIKDTQEKAFGYADDMLYADKLSKKLRNCPLEPT